MFYDDLRYKQPFHEVDRYIDKIQSLEDKFELYCECHEYRKAAEVGYKLRDRSRLSAVSSVIPVALFRQFRLLGCALRIRN